MKKLSLLLALVFSLPVFLTGQVTVHVSGTVTRDSSQVPVISHEVIILADSNPSGFTFWAQRFTNASGFYDCTIPNVPGGVQTTFVVKTKNCDSLWLEQTFQTNNSPATVNFVLCNTTVGCEADFHAVTDSLHPLHIHFFDVSAVTGTVISRSWNFGDGTPVATTPDPWHEYAAYGTYQVCLTIATSTGYTCTKCKLVEVSLPAGCEARYTYSHDSIQPPYEYHFFDASTGNPTSWEWDFGDPASGVNNVSTQKNAGHVFSSPGLYRVCHSIHGGNCQSCTCDTIRAGDPPAGCVSTFTYAKNFLTVNFESHVTSSYPTTYLWCFGEPSSGNANSSAEKHPHHTYAAPGSYTATLQTLDSTGCTWSSSQTFCVSATCDVNGHVAMGNTFVDHGLIELIRVDSGNSMTVAQSHEFGDSSGTYHFGGVLPGHYLIKAQLLSTSARYGDFIPTYYEEAANWSDANLIEPGHPDNPYSFHLIEAGLLAPGNGTIAGTITQGVKINSGGTPAPDVEVLILNTENVPLEAATTDADGYFEFGSIAMGSYIVYPEVAGYTTTPARITLDNANPVANTPFSITGGQVVYGIRENLPQFITGISDLFPNPPEEGVAFLEVSVTRSLILDFILYDQTGKVVFFSRQNMQKGDNRVKFDVNRLAGGVYFLKISSDGDGHVVRKLSVIR